MHLNNGKFTCSRAVVDVGFVVAGVLLPLVQELCGEQEIGGCIVVIIVGDELLF